jgi:hypothetical protein
MQMVVQNVIIFSCHDSFGSYNENEYLTQVSKNVGYAIPYVKSSIVTHIIQMIVTWIFVLVTTVFKIIACLQEDILHLCYKVYLVDI